MAIELIKTLELCYPLIQCLNNKTIYYIDTSVLLENTLLVKFIYKTTFGTRVAYFPLTSEDIDDVISRFFTVVYANSP